MGKIRTRILGLEEEEKKQKDEQKKKSVEKKAKGNAVIASETKQSLPRQQAGQDEIATSQGPRDDKKKAKKKESKTPQVRVRGKKYTAARKLVDDRKKYTLEEAIGQLKKIKFAKFDESVELHINVDKTGLRGEVELPHSTGKTVRVAIVTDALLTELENGTINFDMLVTHPSYMPKLARFAKILGPKGLMPNPKAGTVSPQPEEVVKKFEKGTLRWKTEPKFPLIHQMIGKVSYDEKALVENAKSFLKSVGKAHMSEVFIKTTMSPSLQITIDWL